MSNPIRDILIVGGGTAGWMTAALLNRYLPPPRYRITLVESPRLPTIGVGEATIPPLIPFLRKIGISEDDFLLGTNATYKLGIRFDDWRVGNDVYWHPFGVVGGTIDGVLLFQHWLKARREGRDASPYTAYSLQVGLAEASKSPRPHQGTSQVLEHGTHAYHLDATAFAQLLRDVATQRGVQHVSDDVRGVARDERGLVLHVETATSGPLPADLFVDCTGFRGHLIERALGEGWEDWSDTLLCDRAVTLQRPRESEIPPYTRSKALSAGWAWHIPLAARTGCGYVYASPFTSDEEACRSLLSQVGGDPERDAPQAIRMRVGCRRRFWSGNCVAIGLAAGFVEPLESTGIHLIQKGVELLLDHLPDRSHDPALARHYDREMRALFDEVRDFVLLHYVRSSRDDTEFWRAHRGVALPDTLRQMLELYEQTGFLDWPHGAIFTETSVCAILAGLEHLPKRHLPRADASDPERSWAVLRQISEHNTKVVESLPRHAEFIDGLHLRHDPASA